MTRQEFMTRLERLLWDVPENDRLDAMAYYYDYFEEAGSENEAEVIQELGSPEKVASMIKEASGSTYGTGYGEYTERGYSAGSYVERGNSEDWRSAMNNRRNTHLEKQDVHYEENITAVGRLKTSIPIPVLIILIIIATPVLIGIAAGLFGGMIGLLGAAIGVVAATFGSGIGLSIGGIVCFIVGVVRVFINPLEGLTSMGVGALLTAVGLLLLLLFMWLVCRWLPAIGRGLINACKKVYHYIKGRRE